jgi:response regulator RpfG family c-di-GMP phosphodiesterase
VEAGHRYPAEKAMPSNGLTKQVLSEGRSIIWLDAEQIHIHNAEHFGAPVHVQSVIGVPMKSGERTIGIISAQSYDAYAYGSEEQALLEMLATHAVTAIENTRLYDETQRRLKELEVINRVSMSLRQAQSPKEMLPILLNETLQLINTPHGSVWLYDHSSNLLRQQVANGAEARLKYKAIHPQEGIIGNTFTSGMIYTSADLKSDPKLFEGNRESVTPGLGAVCIPIQSTSGPVGVLNIALESRRQIHDELNLLIILAEITGNAIHRSQLYEQSQRQVRRLTTLRDIDAAIASSFDLRLTLNILMDQTLSHLAVDAVDIVLYYPDIQSLNYLVGSGFRTTSPTRPQMRIGEGLAGQVIMRQQTLQVNDLQNAPETRNEILIKREGFAAYIGIPLIIKGQIKGVFEIFHRSGLSPTPDWIDFLHTLAGQAAIAIDNSHLFENLQRSNQELMQAYDTTLEGWARALELRDQETEGHTRRVTEMTIRLAKYMGIKDSDLVNVRRGVLLHDIGKMGVRDDILRKPGPLTPDEWVEMRKHPVDAYNLLSPIEYLRDALDIPYCHHEHWDGSGYPRGLKGTQIPLAARIFSVVDIWDALLSDRAYRKAWKQEKVIAHLKEISGQILDSSIVEVFLRMIKDTESETG